MVAGMSRTWAIAGGFTHDIRVVVTSPLGSLVGNFSSTTAAWAFVAELPPKRPNRNPRECGTLSRCWSRCSIASADSERLLRRFRVVSENCLQ